MIEKIGRPAMLEQLAEEASEPAQANLLDMLGQGDMTQADICARTGKGRSTVSRQIRQLEAVGLVEKMPDGRWHAKGVN